MTIFDFVKGADLNKEVSALNPYYEKMEKVTTQATRHCTRSDMSEFYNIVRPNEEKIFIEWRNSNKRNITVSSILSFKRMLKRVLKSSLKIPDLDQKLFDNLNDFLFEELITYLLVDPNAVGIEWPYNPLNPEMPLAVPDSYPQNLPIGTETLIFKYSHVVKIDSDMCVLFLKEENIGTEKNPVYANVHIACDKTNFYKLVPRLVDKKVVYRIVLWYKHELNRLPIFAMPGVKTEGYNESYAWGAYELLDEVVISLSSDQINRVRNVLPKLVINADLICSTCNGAGTTGDMHNKSVCKTCHGSGNLKEIGDFSTVKVRSTSDLDRGNTNPVFYVQQPSDLRYSKEVWEDLLLQAEKQLCTDLLEGTGNESSLAKELRLEPRQDLLVDIGESLCNTIENYINNKRQLVNRKEKYITIVPPSYYETKTPDMLKLYVDQSLPGERQRDYMMYIKNKYMGNDFMINVHMKAILYAPLLLYKTEEAEGVISMGAYQSEDIKRRDYAIMVLTEVMMNGQNMSNKELFQKADNLLIEWGILQPPAEEGDLDEIMTGDNKLLQTVGGVTSIVEVARAVSEGAMTEAAAENLLVTVFGLPKHVADKLIEIPMRAPGSTDSPPEPIQAN